MIHAAINGFLKNRILNIFFREENSSPVLTCRFFTVMKCTLSRCVFLLHKHSINNKLLTVCSFPAAGRCYCLEQACLLILCNNILSMCLQLQDRYCDFCPLVLMSCLPCGYRSLMCFTSLPVASQDRISPPGAKKQRSLPGTRARVSWSR